MISVRQHIASAHRHSYHWIDRQLKVLEADPDASDEESEALLAMRTQILSRIMDPDAIRAVSTIDVGRIVEEVCTGLRPSLRNVEIEFTVSEGPQARCVKPAFEAALEELLCNAAEILEENGGGEVLVTVTLGSGGIVLVDVFDDGPGVSPSIEKYQMFQINTTTHGSGRGKGLHIAQSLMRDVNGEISLEAPREGRVEYGGAHFRMTLQGA